MCAASQVQSDSRPPPKDRNENPYDFPPNSSIWKLAEITGLIYLEMPDSAGGTISRPVCSGLAISPRLVLTARHCFEDETGAIIGYTHVSIVLGDAKAKPQRTFDLKHDPIDQGEKEDDFAVLQSLTASRAHPIPFLLKVSHQ